MSGNVTITVADGHSVITDQGQFLPGQQCEVPADDYDQLLERGFVHIDYTPLPLPT